QRVARHMGPDNEHLVATQFVRGLDSRELRVHVMTAMGTRPKMNETVIRVRRTAGMLDDSTDVPTSRGGHRRYRDYGSSSEDDDSATDEDYSDGGRRRKQ